MERFHKKVYFPEEDRKLLRSFSERLNELDWKYTAHTLDNLSWRTINLEEVLLYIRDLKFNSEDVFEYYKENGKVFKSCYRINYKDALDIILIISNEKLLVTVYLNSKSDNHDTLNRQLYKQEIK